VKTLEKEKGKVFRVISGSATNPGTKPKIEGRGLAEYGTTVNSTDALEEVLYGYLLDHGLQPKENSSEIAILTEFTTTFGQGFLDSQKTAAKASPDGLRNRRRRARGPGHGSDESVDTLVLPFPLHISWFLGERDDAAKKPSKGEEPPSEDDTAATTLARSSARLALAQLLAAISLEEIRYVGIVATDVRDKLFLARQVRRYCPDVRLLTFESDILLADPAQNDSLRGMLVVSTYPLFNENQVWTTDRSDNKRRRIQFPSEAAQGVYNATLLLLDPNDEKRNLLEYRMPAPTSGQKAPDVRSVVPPVWISVVGSNALWPLKASEVTSSVLHKVRAEPLQPDRGRDADLPLAYRFLMLILVSFSVLSALWYFFGPTPSTFARLKLPLTTMADPASPFLPTQVLFFLFHLLVFGLLLFGIRLFGSAPGSPLEILWELFREEGHRVYAVCFLITGLLGLSAVVTAGSMVVRTLSRSTDAPFGAADKARPVFAALLAGAVIAALVNWLLHGGRNPVGHLLFRERAAHLGSGVSPLLPIVCLSLFFFLVLLGQLSFRAAYESFEVKPATFLPSDAYPPASSTAFGTHLLELIFGEPAPVKGPLARAWQRFAASRLGGPAAAFLENWRSPLILLQITCFAAASIVAIYLFFESLPTFESRKGLDQVLRFSFVVPPVLMVVCFIDVLARWASLREVLASYAGDPVFLAEPSDGPNPFTHLLPRRGKPFFAGVPRLFEIEKAVAKLRALPSQGPPKRRFSTPDEKSDARRRRLYNELLEGAKPLFDAKEPRTPQADEVVRAAVVYMLRVKFTCLRRRLAIPLFGMPLLILALASYPFEPQRLLMLPLSTILLVFVCGTLTLFIDMERNYVVSHVSGTPAGKVTLNGELILKLVVLTVPALFALAGSKVTKGGGVFFSWVQDLLNVLK
jgi:hypothetical protein